MPLLILLLAVTCYCPSVLYAGGEEVYFDRIAITNKTIEICEPKTETKNETINNKTVPVTYVIGAKNVANVTFLGME